MSDSLQPTAACKASLSFAISRSFLKLMSHPLSYPYPPILLPSVFPSIRVFPSESALRIRWPKCWSFNFSISPFNEYSGLISFRIDWFDLFAVQGTLKSLLQHHSSKASILRHSAFFMVQLSHPYMTTGKTKAVIRRTLVGKVMSTWVGSLSLLPGIIPTQGSNPSLPHCRWILYQLSHKESPRILEWVAYPFSSKSSWLMNWTGVSFIAGRFHYWLSYKGSPLSA